MKISFQMKINQKSKKAISILSNTGILSNCHRHFKQHSNVINLYSMKELFDVHRKISAFDYFLQKIRAIAN